MELIFLLSGEHSFRKDDFLKHISELHNINFCGDDKFSDVIDRLKSIDGIDSNVVDDWLLLQDEGILNAKAYDVFGIECGYAAFEYKR